MINSLVHSAASLGKRRQLVIDAWDNLISGHGTNYSAWTVSGSGSSTGSSGITLDGTAGNYAYIPVFGASAGTTYWCCIRWNNRSASAGSIRVQGNGGIQSSQWGDSSGAVFDVATHAVPTNPAYGELIFKIKPFGSGPHRLVISHQASAGQTIRISEVKIYPAPSYDLRIIGRGDQFGSVQSTNATNCVNGILARGYDAIIHVGDSSDTGVNPSVWNQSLRDAAGMGMMCTYGNHDAAFANDATWRSFYGIQAGTNDDNRRFPLTGNRYVHIFTTDVFTDTQYQIGNTRGVALLAAVQSSSAIWKIVSFHYPTITSGANQSQDGFLRAAAGWNWYQNGVPLCINGHNHQLERNMADGIVYQNLAKSGCDTHAWSTIEATSAHRTGVISGSGWIGTRNVSGIANPLSVGQGYMLFSFNPSEMWCEYYVVESAGMIDPWNAGGLPTITPTDATTHWLLDRYKFAWV